MGEAALTSNKSVVSSVWWPLACTGQDEHRLESRPGEDAHRLEQCEARLFLSRGHSESEIRDRCEENLDAPLRGFQTQIGHLLLKISLEAQSDY